MPPTTTHARRVRTVQTWLKESGWTVDAQAPAEIVARAQAAWYKTNPRRGAALVARAARLLRGEAVAGAGRPRKWRRVPVND